MFSIYESLCFGFCNNFCNIIYLIGCTEQVLGIIIWNYFFMIWISGEASIISFKRLKSLMSKLCMGFSLVLQQPFLVILNLWCLVRLAVIFCKRTWTIWDLISILSTKSYQKFVILFLKTTFAYFLMHQNTVGLTWTSCSFQVTSEQRKWRKLVMKSGNHLFYHLIKKAQKVMKEFPLHCKWTQKRTSITDLLYISLGNFSSALCKRTTQTSLDFLKEVSQTKELKAA